MKRLEEEPDFLKVKVPELDPESFEAVVMEAFQLEFGITKKGMIAEHLGMHRSRATQVLRAPSRLESAAIGRLIQPLNSARHRGRIIRAWAEARFGLDLSRAQAGRIVGDLITGKTVDRVVRQVNEGRLWTAAETAWEAMNKADNSEIREILLDNLYFIYTRVDQPGRAMTVARYIAEGANKRGDLPRLAYGYLMRARIALSLEASDPKYVFPLFDEADEILCLMDPSKSVDRPYIVASREMVASAKKHAKLTYLERGELLASHAELRAMLEEYTSHAKAKKRTSHARAVFHLGAARVCLLMDELFLAQEHLDKAFRVNRGRNFQVPEMCALVQSRINMRRELRESASSLLREVSDRCIATNDHYHARVAEYDLARVECTRFISSVSA